MPSALDIASIEFVERAKQHKERGEPLFLADLRDRFFPTNDTRAFIHMQRNRLYKQAFVFCKDNHPLEDVLKHIDTLRQLEGFLSLHYVVRHALVWYHTAYRGWFASR